MRTVVLDDRSSILLSTVYGHCRLGKRAAALWWSWNVGVVLCRQLHGFSFLTVLPGGGVRAAMISAR